MYYNQSEYQVKFEWGLEGLRELLPVSDIIVIVDVLSFSTCVDIATSRGAIIFPYQWKDNTAGDYARQKGANLAARRSEKGKYSLSPQSLLTIPSNKKIVLPSPNGSSLSMATDEVATVCGCIRNAQAVAKYCQDQAERITVIAAGERWSPSGRLRVATEDLLGSGAIMSHLESTFSPEAIYAREAFLQRPIDLYSTIAHCSSGKELLGRGFYQDVILAAEYNVSESVPLLVEETYQDINIRDKNISNRAK